MSLDDILYLLRHPQACAGLITWPRFSLSSYKLVSSLSRQGVVPRTVIDVGANVGQFSIACSKIFRQCEIYAFEPLPQCAPELTRHASSVKGMHFSPIALGAAQGEVVFHINSHSHSSSILPLGTAHREAFPGAREVQSITVPMSTLDDELGSASFDGPVLLKLDVQGYEPNVLRGGEKTLSKTDFVLLETSFRPLYQGEQTFIQIADSMANRGFKFLRPISWLSDPRTGEILQADALFAVKR